MLLLPVIGILAAQPCMNMKPSASTLPATCRTCGPFGPIPGGNGLTCSYYQASAQFWCDCNPTTDCKPTQPLPITAKAQWFTNGVCAGGVCCYATPGPWVENEYMPKYLWPCPGS